MRSNGNTIHLFLVGQVVNLRRIANPPALWGSQSWLQPAFSRLLEFVHFRVYPAKISLDFLREFP
jgi:hypothetical protein